MKEINVENLLYKLILFFPITTLFQGYLDFINKVQFGMILACIFFLLTRKRIIIEKSLFWLSLIIIYVVAIYNTNFPLYNGNDVFYFGFWIIYALFMQYYHKSFEFFLIKNKKLVTSIIKIWSLIVFVSILLPSSYGRSWGSGIYFKSFTDSIWRLAPTAVFILSLVILGLILYRDKKYVWYSIIPMYCFYMGGARTYLGVGILLFFILWYVYKTKPNFYLTIIPLCIILFSIISFTAIQSKLNATTYSQNSYFDFWGTITSGRSIIWAADLEAYSQLPLVNKILGNGFNFVYNINYSVIHALIWAHNDFIQILTTFGFISLVIYIFSIKRLYNLFLKDKDIPRLLILLLILVWGVNAFFNMFYTYFATALSYPILLLAIRHKYQKE